MQISRHTGFPSLGERSLFWLGQAGFWFDTGRHTVLIDPYLSDSLAKKYAGHANDHQRMMEPPLTPDALPEPDVVLITHAHTDHMDPETLGPLAKRFPSLPFVAPSASLDVARQRIGANAHLIPVSDGDEVSPLPGLKIQVLPAAHETLERDEAGNAVYLGYFLRTTGFSLYHSGDCIPFEGLDEAVRALGADIALLPVNGRDRQRLDAGIPGNFTLQEAINLCRVASIGSMVPHHFGMFSFNTLAEEYIDDEAARCDVPTIFKPVIGERLRFDN